MDGTITGKLSGRTLVDNPADNSGDANVTPASAPSVTLAEILWGVTREGTCELTVTSVLAADGSPLDAAGAALAPDCGGGLCGAGDMPIAPLTLLGIAGLRRRGRRPAARS